MNFKIFYKDIESRLETSILSLWATGEGEIRSYFKHIFQTESEKLIAEPVFQTTFPWKPSKSKFEDLTNIYDEKFINAIDNVEDTYKEYRFPKNRNPYEHQVLSWEKLIKDKKSVAVTTGTGSGKTECFMLPVLYDIYKNSRNNQGVNAIFLYPLNALINSQKKRMHAWTKAIGGINYAVYNGNTEEDVNRLDQEEAYPQIISRVGIRSRPPQILFTNPTMLEYILVRKDDVELLENSQGSLRWILLDEAHTLTGSKAAEMSMLIRRVIDAFGVKIEDVRFAITSATVGNSSDEELKTFMSDLCGISKDSIEIITGTRVMPELPKPSANQCTFQDIKNSVPEERSKYRVVQELMEDILSKNYLSLSEIAAPFNLTNIDDKLELVDILAETKIDEKAILPVRGHFFARGMGGVYVCTNPNCDKHGEHKPITALGTMSTIAEKECSHCGSIMVELVACRTCGNYLLYGDKISEVNSDSRKVIEYVRIPNKVSNDDIYIVDVEEPEPEDQEMEAHIMDDIFYVAKYSKEKKDKYVDGASASIAISEKGEIIQGEQYIGAKNNSGNNICPHCGESALNPMHFRISASMMNRVLSDIILEQTPKQSIESNNRPVYNGHKYISFTDSRQGTARVAALVNIDNESRWVQSKIFHLLCLTRKNSANQGGMRGASTEELSAAKKQLEINITTTIPLLRRGVQEQLDEINRILNSNGIPDAKNSRIAWNRIIEKISIDDNSFHILCENAELNEHRERYLRAILFDQFSRRLPRERSMENLGMVSIVYPELERINRPEIAQTLDITEDEWKDLLKISVDYILRFSKHLLIPDFVNVYSTKDHEGFPINIDSGNTEQYTTNVWPKYDKRKILNRLSLLIFAGLGYTDLKEIDTVMSSKVNELMRAIWSALVESQTIERSSNGFLLDLEDKASFELPDKIWKCPVKNRFIDRQFRGISPWIKGQLTEGNIQHYTLGEAIPVPYFPYPFNLDEKQNYDIDATKEWIENNFSEFKALGLWNDLHEKIIYNVPVYVAKEHSAQQRKEILAAIEKGFETGKVNILSCSTTMEMGVDIGDITAVVMNNVPPHPANYLQRAGRGGRRMDTKSLALTFCASNPIGTNAIMNPKWALEHKIAPPKLIFNSYSIVERHINAFFFGKFIQEIEKGIIINEELQNFFALNSYSIDDNGELDTAQAQSSIANRFKSWIGDQGSDLDKYNAALNLLTSNTPLKDEDHSELLEKVHSNYDKILSSVEAQTKAYLKRLNEIRTEHPLGENSLQYKAVFIKYTQFCNSKLIAYFADQGFISSAGIPTGVVEFETSNYKKIEQNYRFSTFTNDNPSYHITRAISEFAPGNEIVINGKNYESAGILMNASMNSQTQRNIVQVCSQCGYQEIVQVDRNRSEELNRCRICGHEDSMYGLQFTNDGASRDPENWLRFTELVEPVGFAVDINKDPTRKIKETSNSQYVEPLLLNVRPWDSENSGKSIFDIRDSERCATILYYNKGNGKGYSICLKCGRTSHSNNLGTTHSALRDSNNRNTPPCDGTIIPNAIIGGRLYTDYCEMRLFDSTTEKYSNDEQLMYSLGVILTKTFAEYLGIEEKELEFGVKRYRDYRSIFIFDTAKGGAGYSVQFNDYVEDIIKIALQKLENSCKCHDESKENTAGKACNKCLVDRSSQWHLHRLNKKKAVDWLRKAVMTEVPEEYKKEIPTLKTIFGTLRNDINRNLGKAKRIYMYVDNQINNWQDIDRSIFFRELRKTLGDRNINFVVSDNLNYDNDISNHLTAIRLSNWVNYQKDTTQYSKLVPMCKLEFKNGKSKEYYTEEFSNVLDESWGLNIEGQIYSSMNDSPIFEYETIEPEFPKESPSTMMVEFGVEEVNSNQFAKLFIDNVQKLNKIDLQNIMQNQEFDIIYNDRYINSRFACLLLVQFIKGLEENLKFSIKSTKLILPFKYDDRYQKPIYETFNSSFDRDSFIKRIAQNNGVEINIEQAMTAHFRKFIFKNAKTEISIYVDYGIAGGWKVKTPSFEEDIYLIGTETIKIIRDKHWKATKIEPLVFWIKVDTK